MASTNTTANYGLPQYISTDKPTYLGDFNGAMLSIDTAIKGVSDMATANQSNISQAQTDITNHDSRLGNVEAETTVNTSDIATANQNIINLQSQTNTQGQQIATITQNTNANTLVIGSGELDTEAKTIIPAINELNSNLFPTTRIINARFFFYSTGNVAVSNSVYVPNANKYNYNIDYISITSGNELDASNFDCNTDVGSAGNGEYISLITWNNYNVVANKLVNCKITATLKS